MSEIFLISRRTERDVIRNDHVRYPLFFPDLTETLIFAIYFQKKFSVTKFHKNYSTTLPPTSGSRVFPCGWTDGHAFRNFANDPKTQILYKRIPLPPDDRPIAVNKYYYYYYSYHVTQIKIVRDPGNKNEIIR